MIQKQFIYDTRSNIIEIFLNLVTQIKIRKVVYKVFNITNRQGEGVFSRPVCTVYTITMLLVIKMWPIFQYVGGCWGVLRRCGGHTSVTVKSN